MRTSGRRIKWTPHPRQAALLECPIEDVFFGGARGGGKTDALLGDWLYHAKLYREAAKGILIRSEYPQFKDIFERSMDLFPTVGAEFIKNPPAWTFPNGATLVFRHLKTESDATKYQGHSYSWLAFEELTNWPSPKPLDRMRATLRSPEGIPCLIRSTGNPGGPGHNWVKSRYVSPANPFEVHVDRVRIGDEEIEVERVYIPSRLEDNPTLTKNDPDYWKRVALAAYGREDLLRAWRRGDWDIVAGGMFDDVWNEARHWIHPFEIPSSWKIDRALDWGSAKPFSVGWYAESDGTTAPNGRLYPRGTLFRIAEWYGSRGENDGLRMDPRSVARGILERERALKITGRVKPGPADTQIYASDGRVRTIADEMREEGVLWTAADKSPGSRKTGWALMRQRLGASQNGGEDPGLFVFNRCMDFRRTIPVLPRDENDGDDLDTNAEDHIADEVRYRISVRRLAIRQGKLGGV